MSTISAGGLARLARRIGCPRLLRRFARHKEGAAAVEFGLVAAPFLALTFAIIETALVFFAGQTLETAVADSARLIMTGQAQKQSFDQAAFKNAVCSRIVALFNCSGGVHVDVRTYSGFSSATPAAPIDAEGKLIQDFAYNPGGPGDIVVVRVMYEWPTWTSILGFSISNLANGKRLLMASAAFRNEPYQ